MAGSNLNILEEEVDIQVQKEYFYLVSHLSRHPETYRQLQKEYLERINDLFDPEIDSETKKKMLVVLATLDDVAVYRTIENFSRQESPLQKWGIIALQQSRMLLQSNLSDNPGVFISTGLGGQDSLLRYFCVFFNQQNKDLPAFQQNTLKNELETAVHTAQGKVENIEFKPDYTTALVLLPLKTELQPLFTGLIDECNQYGNFLHENMIITNVKKLTEEEIHQMLRDKSSRKTLR